MADFLLFVDDERAQKSSPSQLTAAGGLGTLMSSYTGDSSDEEGGIKESEGSALNHHSVGVQAMSHILREASAWPSG